MLRFWLTLLLFSVVAVTAFVGFTLLSFSADRLTAELSELRWFVSMTIISVWIVYTAKTWES